MATDDFNRSNADTLGSPWSAHGDAVWGIRSNQAALVSGTSRCVATRRDVASGNVNIKVKVTEVDSAGVRIVFRSNSAGTSFVEAFYSVAGAYTVINTVVSGTETAVSDFTFPGSSVQNGDIIEVNADGADIDLYRTRGGTRTLINGTGSSSHNSTEIGHGICSVANTALRYDDFEVTAIGGSTPLSAGTASFVSSGPGGISVSATAPADGTGAGPTYQWERNSDGGSYSDVRGATSLTLTDSTATTAGVLYRYRCKQTRGSETVTTNAVAAQFYSGGAISSGAGGVSRGRLVNAGGV
jgi:hypothetical protein